MPAVPKIIVTEPLIEEAMDWLSSRAAVVRMPADHRDFSAEMADADGLIVRTYTTVDMGLLDLAPRLRVVGRGGTGLDNIDIAACEARSIKVVHTPDANRQAVVEYVTSILLSSFRPLPPAVAGGLTPEAWADARRMAMAPKQLSECMLGVLGMGRIGRRVAQVAAALGCRLQYHDLVEIPGRDRHRSKEVGLHQLLATSDIVSVHVDGRDQNRHLLGEPQLSLLSDHALLVNTSRGFVIDNSALASLLAAQPHIRAVLDVHEREPVPQDDPLLGCPNALLLPHAASRTEAAQRAMSWVVREVMQAIQGDHPK
jgi:phosphoglycerate dehydrogenase-like enzyme